MRVLVVEDQIKMAQFLRKSLEQAGYACDLAECSAAAESLVAENEYDLVVLDVMLPDQNGMDTARHIRRDGYKGLILMLTALSTTKDKVHGLDAGADDYMTKPYEIDELMARIRALLRRNSATGTNSVLSYEDLEMDLVSRKVKRETQDISLTSKEFALLEYLLRNADRPVTRSQISEHVWDVSFDTDSNVIDVYIKLLRKKVDQGFSSKLIQTVVGVGYVLRSNGKDSET